MPADRQADLAVVILVNICPDTFAFLTETVFVRGSCI